MNLVQTRIAAGGAGNAVAHVLKADGNEYIEVLSGSAEDALSAEAMAMSDGHKYGLRHIIINPEEELTSEQLEWMIDQINEEYGFAADDPMLIVKHQKNRNSEGPSAAHYHILRASSSADGKVYDAFNFQKRNELIARRSEIEFGHRQIRGKHNTYVYHQLVDRGDQATADRVHHLTESSPSLAKFGSKSKAKAERAGVDLPAISAAIASLKGQGPAQMAQGLSAIEEQFPGISIDRGDRRKVIVVRANEEVLLNANKGLGIKASDVDEILKSKEKYDERQQFTLIEDRDIFNADSAFDSSSTGEPGRETRSEISTDVRRNPDDPRGRSDGRGGASEGRDAANVRINLAVYRERTRTRIRTLQNDDVSAGRSARSDKNDSEKYAVYSRRSESSLSRSQLAAVGKVHFANKAAGSLRASRSSLRNSSKQISKRHTNMMKRGAADAMFRGQSSQSGSFGMLDGDDFNALAAFFRQAAANMSNSM